MVDFLSLSSRDLNTTSFQVFLPLLATTMDVPLLLQQWTLSPTGLWTLTLTCSLSVVTLSALLIGTKKANRVLHSLRIFSEDVFLFFLTAGWLMIASVPYGSLLFWRWGVELYMRIKYGPLGNLVKGLDTVGTIDSLNSRQIIKSLKVLEGPCDLGDMRRRCLATVSRTNVKGKLVFPKFYQELGTCAGFYCWRPSNFDIKHHVRFVDGMNMKSKSLSETEALQLVSKICEKPFEPGRANWEILIIPRFHYDDETPVPVGNKGEIKQGTDENNNSDVNNNQASKFALLIRIHHGIGDGFSLMKLILRDMAGEPELAAIPIPKRSETSWLYKIAVFSYVFFKSPRAFYSEMKLRDHNALHNKKSVISGEKEIVWSKPINVAWLKNTKTAMKSGMSTILLSAFAGAVRRYMIEVKKTPEDEIPLNFSALIPMPAPNHPDDQMCNKFSAIMFKLDCKSSDPVKRSRSIAREGRIMASSPDAPVNLFLMDLIGVMPRLFSKYFVKNTQTTAVVSNIPGPTRSISIWGRKLVDTIFWLPNVGDSGISISYLSYRSHVRIGLMLDSGIISEENGSTKLLNWIVDELKIMSKKVGISTDRVYLNFKNYETVTETHAEKIPKTISPNTTRKRKTFSARETVLKTRHLREIHLNGRS